MTTFASSKNLLLYYFYRGVLSKGNYTVDRYRSLSLKKGFAKHYLCRQLPSAPNLWYHTKGRGNPALPRKEPEKKT